MKITLDGPSGAGKSTVAKTIASKLNIVYIDTGAMYRAVGLYCIKNNIDTKDIDAVTSSLDKINVSIKYENGEQVVYLNEENVNGLIRTPDVSMAASNVSAIPVVRLKLVELQRKLSENTDVIMDGRDAGSYVLPDAEVKIYLTASAETRAKRRLLELEQKGTKTNFEEVLADIKLRDKNDSEREFAPLKVPDGAVIVDTSELDFNQSVSAVLKVIGDYDA